MKHPAIFLDRDGVINVDRITDYTFKKEHCEFYPEIFEALQKIPNIYKKIVVTNQAGIAKGRYTDTEYQELKTWILQELAQKDIFIDQIYHCPHHIEGIVKEYSFDCDCRKPKMGMLKQAAIDHNIDLSKSWLIGDTTTDIQAGHDAGCQTILLKRGWAGRDKKCHTEPDHEAEDLLEAIAAIFPQEDK